MGAMEEDTKEIIPLGISMRAFHQLKQTVASGKITSEV
jgi:hypothetical protein